MFVCFAVDKKNSLCGESFCGGAESSWSGIWPAESMPWWYWRQLRDVFFEVFLPAVISYLSGLIHLKKDRTAFSFCRRRRFHFQRVEASTPFLIWTTTLEVLPLQNGLSTNISLIDFPKYSGIGMSPLCEVLQTFISCWSQVMVTWWFYLWLDVPGLLMIGNF